MFYNLIDISLKYSSDALLLGLPANLVNPNIVVVNGLNWWLKFPDRKFIDLFSFVSWILSNRTISISWNRNKLVDSDCTHCLEKSLVPILFWA